MPDRGRAPRRTHLPSRSGWRGYVHGPLRDTAWIGVGAVIFTPICVWAVQILRALGIIHF